MTNEILCEEDSINVSNEAQIEIQNSIIQPCDGLEIVTIRSIDFQLVMKGQCLTNTIIVDYYLKYQEKKHHCIKGLHFFNNIFFIKFVITYKHDTTNGFEKIGYWHNYTHTFKWFYFPTYSSQSNQIQIFLNSLLENMFLKF